MFVSVTVYIELVFSGRNIHFSTMNTFFKLEVLFRSTKVHFMNIDSEIEANSLQSANSSESIGEL